MRRIVLLSGLAGLIAASLALWPSVSHSASKGRVTPAPSASPGGKGVVASGKPWRPTYLNIKMNKTLVTTKGKTKRRFQDIPATSRHDKSAPKLW